jgi:AcrR family transcriptional regulator
MRLPAKDRREQLMDAAMGLFAVQGFYGTTTREIADAAGVNEAIIFRHFASKEELYWAVVNDRVSKGGRKAKIQRCLDAHEDPKDVLAGIAGSLLERSQEDTALTRLLFFSALRNSDLAESFFRKYMAETFELLSDYFRKGIEKGWFRKIDPMIAARGFLGMITHHFLVQELFGGSRYRQFDPYALGRQLADMWLNGISADAAIEMSAKAVHGNAAKVVAVGSQHRD